MNCAALGRCFLQKPLLRKVLLPFLSLWHIAAGFLKHLAQGRDIAPAGSGIKRLPTAAAFDFPSQFLHDLSGVEAFALECFADSNDYLRFFVDDANEYREEVFNLLLQFKRDLPCNIQGRESNLRKDIVYAVDLLNLVQQALLFLLCLFEFYFFYLFLQTLLFL